MKREPPKCRWKRPGSLSTSSFTSKRSGVCECPRRVGLAGAPQKAASGDGSRPQASATPRGGPQGRGPSHTRWDSATPQPAPPWEDRQRGWPLFALSHHQINKQAKALSLKNEGPPACPFQPPSKLHQPLGLVPEMQHSHTPGAGPAGTGTGRGLRPSGPGLPHCPLRWSHFSRSN